jgi:hypothetical protein
MQRIDTPTAAQDLFGPGKPGFTDGSIPGGVPTTRLNAAWFNAAQEEIARVIEAAGLVLDPGDYTQLLQAIGAVVGDAIENTAIDADKLDGLDSSDFARAADLLAHIQNRGNPHQVTLAQLGGAPLDSPALQGSPSAPTPATNDNDTSLATTAFVQAAIVAALQGAGLGGGFTQSFGDNGWCRMPNGFVIQWGRLALSRGEGTGPNITFPIAFPNNCLAVTALDWNRNAAAQWIWIDCFVQVVSVSPTQFATFVQNPGSNQNHWDGLFWIAVGY